MGVLNCFLQRDTKAFLAYRSIIHINFIFFILLIINNYVKTRRIIIIISHGFISGLIFFFVGEFYKFNSTRFIIYFKNLFISNLFFLFLFLITIMGNSAVPLRVSFFIELVGVYRGFISLLLSFFVIGFYFFFRFYSSFFLLVNSFMGKNLSSYINLNLIFCYFLVVFIYFIFFFSFLFYNMYFK